MKKIVLAIMGCTWVALSVLAADPSALTPATPATPATPGQPASSFTPSQKEEIGKVCADYLLEHPDVLIKASQKLQENEMQAMQQKLLTAVLANKESLLNDKDAPMTKPKNAKVAVIEFFDYQCAYCHKVFPELEKVMKNNPNVQFIFKEFPIFSERWEASKYAAQMGFAVYKLGGIEAYLKYHNALFSSGKQEGQLTVDDVNKCATQAGVDLTKAKVQAAQDEKLVTEGLKSGMKMGFQFTPVFVVLPLIGATEDNTTVVPGYAPEQALQDAIKKAGGTNAAAPAPQPNGSN